MEVTILVNEKNTLEVELKGMDHSLAQILAEKLSAGKDVEFAAYKVEHPLIGHPKIILKAKRGEPMKIVLETLSEIKNEVSTFKSEFVEMVK